FFFLLYTFLFYLFFLFFSKLLIRKTILFITIQQLICFILVNHLHIVVATIISELSFIGCHHVTPILLLPLTLLNQENDKVNSPI
ncbi:uncharacterized protein BX664DRAFT_354537, partial [Halteromyces radiatus]|uniref:uncharacterized protein n=1 Tax=Halteromyces radiatus TaxID=101107 RepID=UPI00221FBCB1